MDIQLQFILQNGHFALDLFAGFVFFASFWLFFDAWTTEKNTKNVLKFIGFLLLAISFLTESTHVEQTSLSDPFALGISSVFSILTIIFRISGYISLIVGLFLDPLQDKPVYKNEGLLNAVGFVGVSPVITGGFAFLYCILSGCVGYLFFLRATRGLERHLRPVAISFFIIAFSEFLSVAQVFRTSSSVDINGFASSFGPIWILEQIVLFIGIVLLARWVFTYLLKRLQTQLFMILTITIISIFLITTVSFTMLLLQNLRQDALSHLQTDVNVLRFSLTSKQAETLSDAQVLAQNPQLQKAVDENDTKTLQDLTTSMLVSKKQGSVIVTSSTSRVLARGEDPERIGDSLSADPLVQKALKGQNISSTVTKDGVLAPEVLMRSVSPIKENNQVIGVVLIDTPIDSAFVDGVKLATGLDSSVYAGNTRSATTFVSPDGTTRLIGIEDQTPAIKKTVLIDGHPYAGNISLLNIPYFAAYLPIKNADGSPIGMLFVGSLQTSVLQTASKSIQITFIITALLVALSLIPAYFVSKYISYQLK